MVGNHHEGGRPVRDLIVTQNITVDGVIEARGDWFGPANVDESDDVAAVLREQSAAADAVLFGRHTFEQMRGYWPLQTDDTSGVHAYLQGVRKYVVSRTLEDPGWQHSTVLRGPLAEEIAALRAAPGRDIVCTGSITLVHALIAADLVDEFRLFTYPVLTGAGRRLFEPPGGLARLILEECRPFASGIVLLRYRRA
jgi:dihydrofolate reductase